MLSKHSHFAPPYRARMTPISHEDGLEGFAGYGESALEDVLDGKVCASDVLVIFMGPCAHRAALIANDNWQVGRKLDGLERDVVRRFLLDHDILAPMATMPDVAARAWQDINHTHTMCKLDAA